MKVGIFLLFFQLLSLVFMEEIDEKLELKFPNENDPENSFRFHIVMNSNAIDEEIIGEIIKVFKKNNIPLNTDNFKKIQCYVNLPSSNVNSRFISILDDENTSENNSNNEFKHLSKKFIDEIAIQYIRYLGKWKIFYLVIFFCSLATCLICLLVGKDIKSLFLCFLGMLFLVLCISSGICAYKYSRMIGRVFYTKTT